MLRAEGSSGSSSYTLKCQKKQHDSTYQRVKHGLATEQQQINELT